MSEHFRPDNLVRMPLSRRERRRMRRMFAQPNRADRRSARTVGVVIAAAACAGLAVALGGGGPPAAVASAVQPAIPFFGTCHYGGGSNCVVDGDTFYYGGDKIRIANIDAPETHPPRCTDEARLGAAATYRLRSLLNNGEIKLTSIDRDEDIYGRKLRHVAVGGSDVGETLVGEGLARPYAGGRQPWC